MFDAPARGEEVVIERDGVRVRLVVDQRVPSEERRPRLGFLTGTVVIHDQDRDAPMDDDQIREMFGDDFFEEYHSDGPTSTDGLAPVDR